MGRYYSGDINGKFWFGVQDSTDASNFGVEYSEPNHVNYYFDKDDLDGINAGLKVCVDGLGTYKKKLDTFFKDNKGYTDEQLCAYLKVEPLQLKELMTLYARLDLGTKIKKCVVKEGCCGFEAEL
jgi:hypothetical protein